jgi:hypothetical protein
VFRRSTKTKRPALGVVEAAVDETQVEEYLDRLGDDGVVAERLDLAVVDLMTVVRSLSTLSSPLALNYLERIQHPMASLGLGSGVFVITRGYVAHLAVEGGPTAYGAADIPVLGTLPPLRRGRPPADLLTRAVKATRRGFVGIRAVNDSVWDGFVFATVGRVHDREQRDANARGDAGPLEAGYLDPVVIDGLVRFGWVLRQVDLHYGQEPERSPAEPEAPPRPTRPAEPSGPELDQQPGDDGDPA